MDGTGHRVRFLASKPFRGNRGTGSQTPFFRHNRHGTLPPTSPGGFMPRGPGRPALRGYKGKFPKAGVGALHPKLCQRFPGFCPHLPPTPSRQVAVLPVAVRPARRILCSALAGPSHLSPEREIGGLVLGLREAGPGLAGGFIPRRGSRGSTLRSRPSTGSPGQMRGRPTFSASDLGRRGHRFGSSPGRAGAPK